VALMVLSVFGGAVALMGTAAATTPTIESVVEYNAPEDDSQGDIEVVFNTGVEPTDGDNFTAGEDVTVMVNGEDVSDRFVVASQPDDGRMVLWSGTDILPSEDFTVTVDGVEDANSSDSASSVEGNGVATASTLNVDADEQPSQTEFQGAPIALNFPNQGQDVFYEVENADSESTVIGPLATGTNSQTAVLETGSLDPTAFNVLVDTNGDTFGDTVGASFNIREFSLTTELTTTGPIFANQSIDGTVNAGVANRIVGVSLVNNETNETVDTAEITLDSQGEGTFSFPSTSIEGNNEYFVETQDAQTGVTAQTDAIAVNPLPTADGSLDTVESPIARNETAEFNISFTNVDQLDPVGYLVLEDTGEGLDYTANITVRDDPDDDSNSGAVVLDTGPNAAAGPNSGFSAIGGITLENVDVDAEGNFDEIDNGEYDVRFNDTSLASAYNEVGATQNDSFTVNENDQNYNVDNLDAINTSGFPQDGTATVEVSFDDTNASRAYLSVGGQGSGYELNVTVRDDPSTNQTDGTISVDLGANDVSASGGLQLVHVETNNTRAVNTDHAVRLDQGTKTSVFNEGADATLFVANTGANYEVESGLSDTILTNETVEYEVSFDDTNNSQAWLVIDDGAGFEAVLNIEDDPASAESSGTITVDTSEIGNGATNIFSTSDGIDIDLANTSATGAGTVDRTTYDVNFSVLSEAQATSAPDDTGALTTRHYILENADVEVDQGDLARFDVRFEEGFDREAYLVLGDVGESGYEVNITISDNATSADNTGTILFNTYEAGNFTGQAAEVTATDGINVSFDQQTDVSGLIAAVEYDVRFDTDSLGGTYTGARTTGTMDIVPRSGDVSVDTWTAPASEVGALQGASAQEIQDMAADGMLTDRDEIAINSQVIGDWDALVYQIQAPGIQGYLETQGGTTQGMVSSDALNLTQQSPGTNTAPKELILSNDASGVDVEYDAEEDMYFVVIDVDQLELNRRTNTNPDGVDAGPPQTGESYDVEFTISDEIGTQAASTDPTDFISAPIELRENNIVDGNYEVLLRENVSVFGSTDLAPGTTFTGETTTDAGLQGNTTTVGDDGQFEVRLLGVGNNVTAGNIYRFSANNVFVRNLTFTLQDTADVTFENQTNVGGDLVIVESGRLSTGGFIAIHDESGAIVGSSKLLAPGSFSDLRIALDEPISENATLVAMPHKDNNANGGANPTGIFNFSSAENQDTPYLFREETNPEDIEGEPSPVTDPANVTYLSEDQVEITRTVTRTVYRDVTRTVTVPVTRTVFVDRTVTRTVEVINTVEVTRTVEVEVEVTRTVTRTVEIIRNNTVEVTRTIIKTVQADSPTPIEETVFVNVTDTPNGQPGLGALVAVIALMAASLLAARRRDW